MLEAVISNAAHVSEDMSRHMPSLVRCDVTYFKPEQLPAGTSEKNRQYWETMMGFSAGNYERYCLQDRMRIVRTPDEHDLMMENTSLNIIVPEILRVIGKEKES